MGFQLTSMSRVFLFPGKPDTVGMMFLTGTVFQETGEKTKAGDPPEDFTKVVLPGTAVEGWMKSSSGIVVPDPVRPPLDVPGFVRSALMGEMAFNDDPDTAPNFVFADYALALAFVESNMNNIELSTVNTGKNPPSDAIGPLQITSVQWQAFLQSPPLKDSTGQETEKFSDLFGSRDRPSGQAWCALSQMRKQARDLRAALPAGTDVTLLDVFYVYLTDGNAGVGAALRGSTAADDIKAPDAFNARLTPALVTEIFGKLQHLVLGSSQPANLGQLKSLIKDGLNAALDKAFTLIKQDAPDQLPPKPPKPTADSETDKPRDPQGPAPASGLNYAAAGVKNAAFQKNGDLIVARFAAAGFNVNQQKAAVANAIGESGLNERAASRPPEKSYGLFQCNTGGGLGNGFTKEQLFNPETNISIILKEAKKQKSFVKATTLEDAVAAFVRDIERPADASGQIALRLKVAKKL